MEHQVDSSHPMEIPLFPLNTVLFPGGHLALRIFEPRYLSMVSDCLRNDRPFGVVRIRDGSEAGDPATFHETGTFARIFDFNQLDSGLLGLSCLGTERFRVIDHSVREDNLSIGKVKILPDMLDDSVSVDLSLHFQSVTEFLRTALDREEMEEYRKNLKEDWEDSSWISFQTAELLPLSDESRQSLLEMSIAERILELGIVLRDNEISFQVAE